MRPAIERAGEGHPAETALLREIAQEHGQAAQRLREAVRRAGGLPASSSGVWGSFAEAIEGSASLFGDVTALRALKEGELLGLEGYREAVERHAPTLPRWISTDLIPAQECHVARVDELIARLEK